MVSTSHEGKTEMCTFYFMKPTVFLQILAIKKNQHKNQTFLSVYHNLHKFFDHLEQ